ncbi:MAG: DUF58 domain-containing protein [Verrucomicrobia bacterium]|nr:DUF58 domain-containing protein [Verrucomicrobiota bacterium]
MSDLLQPELLRKLEQIQLLTARRARSSLRGERRSRVRGLSVEFADHRGYVVGDDLRHLDWNLLGRLDRLFLKLYEEDRELPIRIFLDASESMNFGTPSKFTLARQIAAAVGYIGLCGFDRVSVEVFPAATDPLGAAQRRALRLVRGKRSSLGFFQNLGAVVPGGRADLNTALRRGALEDHQTGVAVVLSDFLDASGFEPGLTALVARGFEVVALQILSPEERDPTQFGDLRLVDSETGQEVDVTFGRYRLKAYQEGLERHVARIREFCSARGIRFLSVRSDADLGTLLLKDLRAGAVWS